MQKQINKISILAIKFLKLAKSVVADNMTIGMDIFNYQQNEQNKRWIVHTLFVYEFRKLINQTKNIF